MSDTFILDSAEINNVSVLIDGNSISLYDNIEKVMLTKTEVINLIAILTEQGFLPY